MLTTATIEKAVAVLGYELKEHLGSGGYGEVWGVTAPGGLPKAIKILFGAKGERRAQTELKSLERIKQIRHPFLLSLERIDIVDDQVVIVTELADRNLADLFEEYVRNGLPGIPRKELIEYMRQAAEVLDYLYNDHSLQHLDVKPENLMLVGKHIKLGDFGLIKDLRDCSQSMIGGLTPNYSAPELFDGCPKSTSDQYSLAIVYQEMLTGTRPFSGVTPVQLASQHLREMPDLMPLPKADRPVVAKALSKSADRRFRTCTEFVEHLINAELLPKKRSRGTILARFMSDTIRQGMVPAAVGDATPSEPTTTFSSIKSPKLQKIEWQSSGDAPPSASTFSPTLFIGVGRSGAEVLRFLKTKLQRCVGELSSVPGVSFLAIDSDPSTVAECSFDSQGLIGLAPHELITIPLRKPETYRNRNAVHASWLHRRWIFNVPKSLQTEGLRPLGRLALADHFEAICSRLMSHLETITGDKALELSAQALAMAPGTQQPRIVLIGAISGGIASGTLLDISYLVKAMLTELGFKQDVSHGILLHGQKAPNRQGELNVANTIAFLTELRHYTQLGYTADQAMGIPDMPDVCPLDIAHVVELGVDLNELDWQRQLNSVAEYIWLSKFTSAQSLLETYWETDTQRDYFALRSFGIHYLYHLDDGPLADLEAHIAQQLVQQWIHGDDPHVVVADALNAFERFCEAKSWLSEIQAQLLTAESIANFRDVLIRSIDPSYVKEDQVMQQINSLLSAVLDSEITATTPGCLTFEDTAHEFVTLQVRQFSNQLVDWVQRELNRPRLHLARITNTLRTLQSRIEQAAARQRSSAQELHSQLVGLNAQMVWDDPKFRLSRKRFDWNYLINRLMDNKVQITSFDFCGRLLKRFSGAVDQTREELFRLQIHLQHIFDAGGKSTATKDSPPPPSFDDHPLSRAAWAKLVAEVPEIVETCQARIFRLFVQPVGGFARILQQLEVYQNQFVQQVQLAVSQELFAASCRLNCDQLVASNLPPSIWQEMMVQASQASLPRIQTKFAKSRLLIAYPTEQTSRYVPETLAKYLPARPAIVPATSGELIVATEAEDIQLADVVYELINQHPNALDMSTRILTRNDIQWQPLKDLF